MTRQIDSAIQAVHASMLVAPVPLPASLLFNLVTGPIWFFGFHPPRVIRRTV